MKSIALLVTKIKKIKTLFTIVILVSSMISLNSCSKDEEPEVTTTTTTTTTTTPTGTTASGFSLQSITGETVSLSDFSDKVLVLFFFGNSCPSCRAVGPSIQREISAAFSSRTDFAIVGIDQWDGNKASVESFKSVTGISFPLLLNGSTVARSYSTTYDRLLVVDKEGKVVFKGNSSASNDINAVVAKVNASF